MSTDYTSIYHRSKCPGVPGVGIPSLALELPRLTSVRSGSKVPPLPRLPSLPQSFGERGKTTRTNNKVSWCREFVIRPKTQISRHVYSKGHVWDKIQSLTALSTWASFLWKWAMEVLKAIVQATATAMDCALVGLVFARYETFSLMILAVSVIAMYLRMLTE